MGIAAAMHGLLAQVEQLEEHVRVLLQLVDVNAAVALFLQMSIPREAHPSTRHRTPGFIEHGRM